MKELNGIAKEFINGAKTVVLMIVMLTSATAQLVQPAPQAGPAPRSVVAK
ncbi:MAG TPA: hypothetical protein VGF12_03680 [Roseateles sp.]